MSEPRYVEKVIRSVDEPLRAEDLVKRVRLPDGSEVQVPMTDEERREIFDEATK